MAAKNFNREQPAGTHPTKGDVRRTESTTPGVGGPTIDPASLFVRSNWEGRLHKGTKQQFIQAGLAKDGQFPGDPGGRKGCASFQADGRPCKAGDPTGRWQVRIKKAGNKGMFTLMIRAPKRKQPADPVPAARVHDGAAVPECGKQVMLRAATHAFHLAKARATAQPTSASAFRDAMADAVWRSLQTTKAILFGGKHASGFRFCDAEAFDDAASELFWALKESDVTFNAVRREQPVALARSRLAAADAGFQRFLQAVSGPLPLQH